MAGRRSAALLAALVSAALVTLAPAQRIDLVDRAALRVCADPANLPFSNDKGAGFANKIAESTR